ncbi:MAG: filament integrity protein FraC [Elainellaceae cyanobacterium]
MTLYLPLRAIISQGLLLLVTIAIEAFVLYQQLNISRKKSIEYSASINLFSTMLGWLAFLSIVPALPTAVEIQLINLIFFDQWTTTTATWLIAAGFLTFFISFAIELLGLEQLQLLLSDRKVVESKERYSKYSNYRSKRISSAGKAPEQTDAVYVILVANAASYTAIIILLFVFRLFSEAQLIPTL